MVKTDTLLDRFLRYVKVDTQSKEDAEEYPSTAKQWDLLKMLAAELKDLGVEDVRLERSGYVMASIPGNLPKTDKAYGKVPAVGFIAHVDTSPEVSGAGVRPQVLTYRGGDIALPGDPAVVIRADENPDLKDNVGKTVITSDGTTLLGADDKAGVAIIMSLVDTILSKPDILHGDIKIAFTPDEEVGAGTKLFDLKSFGAKYAYTIDGDKLGELNKETFSAETAVLTVSGRDIHPGMAKDVMVNATRVACEFVARTPKDMAPETTDGYQPYLHPYVMESGVGKAAVKILLRDFKSDGLKELRRRLESIAAEVRPLFPKAQIDLHFIESYRNMGPILERNQVVLDTLWEAVKRAGIAPRWVPIRGGTDGSRLTEMGLPTPNIWMGGINAHSKTEWAALHAMEKALETVVHLVGVWVEKYR
ncbi:MAG TPA: peptidase T [Elusimicrobia bacterium]|nr:peptidase T [Elusimicrobiota bacterium]HBT61622.1 peptidase T [Elusimicrobiota bacterium]